MSKKLNIEKMNQEVIKTGNILKLWIVLILFITGCTSTSKYKIARNFYQKGNYVAAIQQYDSFLEKSSNGALITKAEIERAESYYQLGLTSYEKENWALAGRLFYLSNSNYADEKLDDCYYQLALKAREQNDIDRTLEYYDYIISHLPSSDMMSSVLYDRILIYSELGEKRLALKDYDQLWLYFPQSEYIDKIEATVSPIISEE
ncbi:MAG: hypothetical protein JW996_00265, partial [Candidatus Cloacimonetes bacterium]|nr:hypothetical protein [Candidatus Cloacimonadota bacterium]